MPSSNEPYYYKYSIKGRSKVNFLKKGGCVAQMQEGCERIEKLLENFINVMFGKWEYPLWDPISGVGKITKYNLWYLLMMSGEIEIHKEDISFKTSNADIGFEEKYHVHQIPESSQNKAVRLFLDKDMIDATLKQNSRKVYRLHQKWLSNFTNIENLISETFTYKSIAQMFPDLDFKEKSPIDIYINPYLPQKIDRDQVDQGPNSFSILKTDYHSRPILSLVNTFSFRILAKNLSTQKWLSFSHGYLTLSANFTLGTASDNDEGTTSNDLVLTILDLQIIGTPKVYEETNKNKLMNSTTLIEKFNTNKYHILAQDFKVNLSNLINFQCLGISKVQIDTEADGINIEAIKSN